jgi:putative DNA primase/helicase
MPPTLSIDPDTIYSVPLATDKLVVIDLDECRDPNTGAVEEWASRIVAELDTYTEASPSGKGLRLVAYGRKPDRERSKRGNVEIYDGLTKAGKAGGRYLTFTGQRLLRTPAEISERQEAIVTVYERELKTPQPRTKKVHATEPAAAFTAGINEPSVVPPAPGPPTPLGTDQELIARAKAARNGGKFSQLWAGDWSDYPSQSEADLALCSILLYWTGGDRDRVERLFGQSELGKRAKWTEREGYRKSTIEAALRGASWQSNGQGHPSPAQPDPSGTDPAHCTDRGNALRFGRRHGAEVRHSWPWGKWLIWDSFRWRIDDSGTTMALAKRLIDDLFAWSAKQLAPLVKEVSDPTDTTDTTEARLKALQRFQNWCLKSESAPRLNAMLDLARSEPGIPILPEDLDRDPWLFNCLNGTLELRTGQLREHRREDYLTKLAPVEYHPDAQCPRWLTFLDRIMAGNQALVDYLQRAVGSSLTGDVGEQALFFLHGSGANGKSTFLSTVRGLMGEYAIQAVSELLMAKHTEAHPTERADLRATRFVATVETDQGKRLAESLVKQLTGGDNLRARRMREDFTEFPPTWKIFLAANHKPTIRGTDLAIWRRIKLVPFTVVIPEAERDKQLAGKLQAEWPGILAWAVRGCLQWQQDGLREPPEVTRATEQYRAEQDSVQSFVAACCQVGPTVEETASALYSVYLNWSGDKSLSAKAFGQELDRLGFERKHTRTGPKYRGITLPGVELPPTSEGPRDACDATSV